MKKIGLLAIVIVAFVSTTSAVPRYSASVPQVNDIDGDRARAAKVLNDVPKGTSQVLDALVNQTGHMQSKPEPEGKSIYHNFRDGILSEHSSFTEVISAMIHGSWEYYFQKDRSKWEYLDPEMSNQKFLSKDGHSEKIINSKTGKEVTSGMNQATANQYQSKWYNVLHLRDMFRFPEFGTPSKTDQKIAEYLVSHPEVRDDFIRRAEEMAKDKWLITTGGIIQFTFEEIEKLIVSSAGDPDELKKLNKAKKGNDSNSQQPDLHSLDLDDANGDWCKCAEPGCYENVNEKSWTIRWGCSKCGKVNVTFAKKALAKEAESKAKGQEVWWTGNRSDAVKAAQDSSSKKSTASQERTMTDDDVINLLREDGSSIKAAADVLKE